MAKAKAATDPKAEFEKTLDALIHVLLTAKGHLTIGRGVGKMITEEPEISHAAPTFWALTIYAHYDAAQLLAFKLYDKRPETITIERLLALAEANPQIFRLRSATQVAAIVQTARNQLAGLEAPLKKIHAKRNRIIAHLEQTAIHDPAKVEAATRVTFSDLNEVFLFAEGILNELAGAFRDTAASFDLVGGTDYEVVGDWIVRGKCAHLKQYESEFGPWEGSRPKNCPK
jgi:hypothetical protein